MKRSLQIIALVLAVGGIALWAALGANRGWTRTQTQIKTLDDVTGIEGISYRSQFQPGLDLLGVNLGIAAALGIGSLFFRKPHSLQK
jgi:hypothetical protein